MVYAVIRIRGTVNVKPDIKKTLHLLNLTLSSPVCFVQTSKKELAPFVQYKVILPY